MDAGDWFYLGGQRVVPLPQTLPLAEGVQRVSGGVQTYVGHGQAVYDAATTKDNARIASCGGDKQVRRRRVRADEGATRLPTFVGQCPRLRQRARGGDLRVGGLAFACALSASVR